MPCVQQGIPGLEEIYELIYLRIRYALPKSVEIVLIEARKIGGRGATDTKQILLDDFHVNVITLIFPKKFRGDRDREVRERRPLENSWRELPE